MRRIVSRRRTVVEPDSPRLAPGATFLIGENGSGKSTLIEAIAVASGFNAEGGTTNFRFSTRASESPLHGCIRVARTERRPRTGFFLRASQLVVATHSPVLLALPGALIYRLGADGITSISYEETDAYRLARDFLLDPEKGLEGPAG